MIKIKLHDGRVLDNDPACGLNLDAIAEIQEHLQECEYYYVTGLDGRIGKFHFDEIAEIFEDDKIAPALTEEIRRLRSFLKEVDDSLGEGFADDVLHEMSNAQTTTSWVARLALKVRQVLRGEQS